MLIGKVPHRIRNYSFEGPSSRSYKPFHKQAAHSVLCRSSKRARQQDEEGHPSRQQQLLKLLTAVAVGSVALCPPSIAELQTVAPEQATSLAKPLKAQPVKKGRVWGLFLVGATGLFGGAVALERNSTFFPAINKANQAIAATREAQKKKAKEDKEREEQEAIEVKSEEAVLQGLMDAKSNVMSASTSGQNQPADDSESTTSSRQKSRSEDSEAHNDNSPPTKQNVQLADVESDVAHRKSNQDQQKIAQ